MYVIYPISLHGMELNKSANDGSEFLSTRSASTKEWTFMVYMAGDNSLGAVPQKDMVESDLTELETAGSDSNINIIVLVDKYGTGDSKCYYIEPGNRVEKSLSTIGFTSTELNMGSSDTLRKFVDWSMTTYPANYYFLDMWDHGTGWISFCNDNTNSDEMVATEFETAMKLIKNEHGRVDILGFDACYMANQEMMYQAKNYADIYLASEHREAFDGWDYATSLSWLKSNPTATPTNFAKRFINDYESYYSNYYTLSAIDLKSYDVNVTDYLNLLLQGLQYHANEYNTYISNARGNSLFYRYRTSSNTFCDLYDFVNNIHNSGITNSTILGYCYNLKAKINSSVIWEKHSSELSASHGLTFYFPDSPVYFDYLFLTTKWHQDSAHYDFLKNYWHVKDEVNAVMPTKPTIETAGTTCWINGTGAMVKIDRGDWRTGRVTVGTGLHTIYARKGNDYSETNSTTISGISLIITPVSGTSFTVTFSKGWNLVCAPQHDTFTAKTLCIEMGAKEIIQRGSSGAWEEYVYNYSSDSKDFTIDTTNGYYIYFESAKSYTFQNMVERPVSVATGWNLLGFCIDNKASTVLAKSDSMKNMVYRSDNGTYSSYNTEAKIGDFTVSKGYAGFVYASNPVAVRI
jgi:hypothetical protein